MASVAKRVRRGVCLARLPGRSGAKSRPGTRRCGACLAAVGAFARSSRGNAAIEFGLLAPVFLLILVPVIELGLVLRARFLLSTQVTSAANYSLVHGGMETDAEKFAKEIVEQLVPGDVEASRGIETATVDFNNAATATRELGEDTTSAAGSGDVAQCYCPVRTDGETEWRDAGTCQTPCPEPNGTSAGRYIEITASTAHSSFLGELVFDSNTIAVHTLVRVE